MTGSKIINGTPVDAPTTNAALLARQADDTATGVLTLNNTLDVNSGNQIDNIQNEHNSIASFVGKATNLGPAAMPTWTTDESFTPNEPVFNRADALSSKFPNATGHNHDPGIPGSGGAVTASSIFTVVLHGYIIRGVDITGAAGGSTDVSTDFAAAQPSTSTGQKGVVVNAPYNKIILRQATGIDAGDQFVDTLGNQVYGRLTNTGGVGGTWTLTYYVDISGTETPYSFPSPVNVAYYYQQLFNPITDAPVYSEFAVIPSENATEDILDASPTQSGKVNTLAQDFGGLKGFVRGIRYFEYADSTTTGSGATVPLGANGWIQLTNASLASIAMVGTPSSGELRVLSNDTGSTVNILNNSGATASLRILTGTGADMSLKQDAAIVIAYDSLSLRWKIVGGGGGGSGSTTVIGTRGTPIVIDPAVGFSSAVISIAVTDQTIFVESLNPGVDNISASPEIAAHTIIGARLLIIGRSNTNVVGLLNASGDTELNGDCDFYSGQQLSLIWDGTAWTETSRS